VRDEDERAVEPAQRALELLDRRQIEVIRRLVEHETARSARRLERELGPRSLTRRKTPGRAHYVVGVEVELGEERARISLAQ
jgi:hypothetical protein